MKISEMSFSQASAVMLRIAAPVANICDDDELSGILKDFLAMRVRPNIASYGNMIPRLLTYCLENHRADTYEIISALLDIPTGKIGDTPFMEIVNGLKDSYDEVIVGFFTRSKAAKRSEGTER